MNNMQKFSNPIKSTLVATDVAMKCEVVQKEVIWHIKTISIRRQSRYNEQHAKVLQPHDHEIDLGGHGHGHEVWSSAEGGDVAHNN